MASLFNVFCSPPALNKSRFGRRMSENEFLIEKLGERIQKSVRSAADDYLDEDDTSSGGSYSPRNTFHLDGPESISRDFYVSNQGATGYYEITDAIEIYRVECRAHIRHSKKIEPCSDDESDHDRAADGERSHRSDHDRAADGERSHRSDHHRAADVRISHHSDHHGAADGGSHSRAKYDAGEDLASESSMGPQQDEEVESTTASTFEGQESSKTRHIYGLLPETEELYRRVISESLTPSNTYGEWKNVKSSKPYVHLRSCRQSGQSKFYLHLITEIAAPITHCMSIGYEQDIFQKWNPIVIKNAPVGENTIPYSVAHWEKSIAAGFLKSDSLHENFRWLDMQKGIYVEHTRPLSKDSELQFKPRKGFKREEMMNYFMMIPIKEGKATLWISTSMVDMGINVYDFMADRLLPIVSNETQDAIERTSLMIRDPKKGAEWMQRIKKDETGMYTLLNKVAERSTSHQKQIGREWSSSNVPTMEDLLDF